MANIQNLKLGDYLEYNNITRVSQADITPCYGRVCKFVGAAKLHIQRFLTAKDTVLGNQCTEGEIFSTGDCDEIAFSQVQRKVSIRGPFDWHDFVSLPELSYRFRYNTSNHSFTTDRNSYMFDEKGGCDVCAERCNNEKITFHVKRSLLSGTCEFFLGIGRQRLVVGDFIVTAADLTRGFPWRRSTKIPDLERPSPEDKNFPEAWRIPKAARKHVAVSLKTVCKVTSIGVRKNELLTRGMQQITATDVEIRARVFHRPSDIGASHECAFEVIETDMCGEVEQVIQVVHTSFPKDLQGWLHKGVFRGHARFHYSKFFNTSTRQVSEAVVPTPIYNKSIMVRAPMPKLASLDLFSGCGGLSLGLEASGLVESKWAVEWDEKAASSFRSNFPHCTVFNIDAEKWFEKLLVSQCDQTLPQPGSVDIICGGPPCQGFSRMNRHKGSAVSVRKRLLTSLFFDICVYLKPRFILFENVAAFCTDNNGSNVEKSVAVLVSAGYQVRFALLRAAAYGVPQSRLRTIIIAAAAGEVLPNFPVEQFSIPGKTPAYKVGLRVSCTQVDGPYLYYGQTIWDAIGDLSKVAAESTATMYPSPMSALQSKLRNGSEIVTRHQPIRKMSDLDKLRTKYIPQGGDWRWLPNHSVVGEDAVAVASPLVYTGMGQKKLMCSKRGSGQTVIPFSLAQTATNNGHWSGAYGRLHPRMFFPTLLTQLSPLKRNGKVFHPVQDRYITVRECARAQTFPDTFSLDGDREEAIKQLGNAVPPLMAEAIGCAMREAIQPRPL